MTELVLLPLQRSIQNDEIDEDIPFRIINQDNLPMTQIFKPFGIEQQKRKPNGIVYPTRRNDLNTIQHLTKSNGHLAEDFKKINKNIKLSASHGNLNQNQDDFVKNLDAKLRKLQKNGDKKKPFISTVKKGKFLEPETSPNDIVNDDDEIKKFSKKLYAYDSKPMVLSRSPPQNVHRSRCEAAAIAAGLTYEEKENFDDQKQRKKREAVMPLIVQPSEKRQFKEKNLTKIELPKWNPYFAYARLLSQEDQIKETRAEITKRRSEARKKAKLQSKLPNLPKIKEKTSTIEIQTENYLEATLIKPPNFSIESQTDFIDYGKVKENLSKETQVFLQDFYEDEDIQETLEILVGKTIETALIEILEEEELSCFKEQERRYFDLTENEIQEKIIFENYLLQLIPPVVDELKNEGMITGNEFPKNGTFLKWLIEEVTNELGDILSTGDVLIGIVRDILNRRKEISIALNELNE